MNDDRESETYGDYEDGFYIPEGDKLEFDDDSNSSEAVGDLEFGEDSGYYYYPYDDDRYS